MPDRVHRIGGTGPRGGVLIGFHCPGCGYGHPFEIEAPNGAGWTWNGSLERPTFQPSLLVYGGGSTPEFPLRESETPRCHSFVTDGRIQFLADCTHALAGQTVDLPDWDDA